MHDQSSSAPAGKLLIKNVGLMLTGDLNEPIKDADAVFCEDGLIVEIGRLGDLDCEQADMVIDANGCALAPGLIDSHVHPVFGDWTPRQNQIGWIESFMNGGVTSMISAGEVHLPGRPRDIVGIKALAITAQRAYANSRPGGVKLLAGAPVIEHGMVEEDFRELAAAGVTLLGEIGLGSVKDGPTARKMVEWSRKYGIQSTIHTGGPSVPGSGYVDAEMVLEADADIIGHINGGHTALSTKQIRCLCEGCGRAIEIVHNGNEFAALFALRSAKELRQLDRVILGTDSPAGSGVQPTGILRLIAMLSSIGEVPAEQAICFATGNTARIRNLNCGFIEVGRAADFVFLDTAQHSSKSNLLESIAAGDLPGVGMVVIDGLVRCGRSRNTPPAARIPQILQHA
ncbi:amidohydrolase family protein [Variovorax paradoxus]|uniref:amidohydrolase family protein n=1 Tax=Variovorax paradoxus TaxID=34073 RepID=UPI0029C909CF|nr:amidohydrolase family protein [Variovorax paradoxus]